MEILKYIAVGIAGYLLGSVSISILMSKKAMGGDVREKGSGNAGATNMARVYGWSAGLITLGGDMLKAAIAMLIGLLLLGDLGIAIGGIAAMIGHCFPAFYGFKGGKGVSILAAVACFMDWRTVVIGLAVFIIVAMLTKKVSPGSLAAAVSVPVISWLVGVSTPKLVLAVFAGIMVIIQHRANIKRLINGTEANFKAAKK
ncbi:MAG: glycerol-3-phosphate 1-O-acyltransferase PlsY [Oscillospiraceae bacterium]|nr:glycerol-3-phosphate 1-O-acyltransferase PlsY [Oscillospiraceae bacterium]